MELASILLNSGEWLYKYIRLQEDGKGYICHEARRISLEYVDGDFPYWKEI